MKKLRDFEKQPIKRPIVPLVEMSLGDNEASKRLIAHATKRVIKQHKEELEKLAYR